ncbi:Aste57867_17260 [Aphanomyces stellatus]|uniref:Aste57867_17260 protein n=1 Tax=Aphanomyces stellatus TaxID=120398 RepID=A0A485L7I7_9STRA|nr:hypothetical protein As57867_017201 [Aphanomyces stellatus]VFT94016.1 Aste57867_17260 [Aphanomyces stellatus]
MAVITSPAADAALRQRKAAPIPPVAHHLTTQEKVDGVLHWAYLNMGGETWDCQPAVWLTDYALAIQCFISSAFVIYYSTERHDGTWYLLYFLAMGTTAALGGVLHHLAFKAMKQFNVHTKSAARRFFGIYLKQTTVDECLTWVWRLVLGFTTLTNFALVAAAASRYLSAHLSELTIWIAGVGYSFVGAAAFVKMQTSIMLLGFLPPMVFGGVSALAALEKGWFYELLVLLFILGGGIIQATEVSPWHKHFNHNALAHVFLSASATFMMMHFHLFA